MPRSVPSVTQPVASVHALHVTVDTYAQCLNLSDTGACGIPSPHLPSTYSETEHVVSALNGRPYQSLSLGKNTHMEQIS